MGVTILNPFVSFPAAGVTTYFEDTFTRADSSTLGTTEVGSLSWTESVGNMEIVSNGVEAVSSGDNIIQVDSGEADGVLTYSVTTSPGTTIAQPLFRFTDTSNYLVVEVAKTSGGSTGMTLYKIVAGAATSLGTYAAGFTTSTTYEIVVRLSGSDIAVDLDGTERITATDSFNSTATRHGHRAFVNVGSGFDDGNSRLESILMESA